MTRSFASFICPVPFTSPTPWRSPVPVRVSGAPVVGALIVLAAVVLAAFPVAAQSAAADTTDAPLPRVVCDLDTVLHLVGFDTREGTAIYSLPDPRAGSGDERRSRLLVTWRQGAETALLEAEQGGRFGGSVGPGPVFALRSCGDRCLQPVERADGAWVPLGETILAPAEATAHATRDGSGRPWVVLHGRAEADGYVTAWAFRLEAGEWRPRGRLVVTATGFPGARSAPGADDAVITGTGRFSATEEPRRWLSALPSTPAARGGQVLPTGPDRAVYLDGRGAFFRTDDGGASWRRSPWTPWAVGGAGGTAEPWVRGEDYFVDPPVAPTEGSLPVVWYDRRLQGSERLVLTEMGPDGRWRQVAELDALIPTSAGEDLTALQVLHAEGGPWSMVFGCVASGGRTALVVREARGAVVGAPRLVAVEPASR